MRFAAFMRWRIVTPVAAVAMSLLAQPANGQGLLWPLFHPHGSYSRTISTGSLATYGGNLTLMPIQGSQAAAVGSTNVNGLTLIPISNTQTAGVMASPGIQFIQTPTSTASVASTGYYLVRSAPAQSNVMIVPIGSQSSSAAAASSGRADADYAVLGAGFGNRISKISELEQTLQGVLGGLLGQGGQNTQNLNVAQLTSMLMGEALKFLSNNSYAGLISDAEPIIERLIGRILQRNGVTPPPPSPPQNNQPITPPSTRPGTIQGNLTTGSQTFTITITVTPGSTSVQPQGSTTLPANLPTFDGTRPAGPPGP